MEKKNKIEELLKEFYLNCIHETVTNKMEFNNETIIKANDKAEKISEQIRKGCIDQSLKADEINNLLEDLYEAYNSITFEVKIQYFVHAFILGLSLNAAAIDFVLSGMDIFHDANKSDNLQ